MGSVPSILAYRALYRESARSQRGTNKKIKDNAKQASKEELTKLVWRDKQTNKYYSEIQ